jgi:internalin A
MPELDMTAAEQVACAEALKRIGECIRRRGTALDLSRLKLGRLPPKILQLPKLTELDLSNNHFETLPPELVQFPDLARLDLSNNPLVTLPPELGELAGLTRLDLNHTPLSVLPPEIGKLTRLTRLYLTHNRLIALPAEVGRLANLTRLYLSDNALATFPPDLSSLTKLTRLDLSRNRLGTLPPEIGQLINLTVLDISHNPLSFLPPEIGALARLTVLKLADTSLAVLPAELGQLANLAELDLACNPLASLPDSLRNLENLERLLLHDNPALQLSPSILGPDPRKIRDSGFASAKSILNFHFGRQSGQTRPLNQVKLILLGRAGAGKTSIVHALRESPFRDKESSTPGIALSDWTMEGAGEASVTAHVWDFSGQEITHPLHPFFFSPRNLYVVVLAGLGHHERDDAEYWLRMIQSSATDAHGESPPVIVALNQWNVPGSRPEVDRVALRERYPFIRGFVEMDCKAKKGIPALKAALFRELERMPWVREPIPEEWDNVRRALASGATHLSDDEYRELCLEHGVKDQGQQNYLSELLHHLGIALNYQNDPRVRDATVWQPAWLIRHLYPLPHRAGKQAGILKQADVEVVMPTTMNASELSCLMQVMERFGIAWGGTAASGGIWLLPHAQTTAPPAGTEVFRDEPDAIRLRYTYQTLPEGWVTRLIARRFDFIEEVREQKLQWRHGVILARKGARALIRMEPQHQQLTITVIGSAKSRHQLADLCQAEIRELHGEFPGLDAIV